MTDTPRTNAFYESRLEADYASLVNADWFNFARELERENARLREALLTIADRTFSNEEECASFANTIWRDTEAK